MQSKLYTPFLIYNMVVQFDPIARFILTSLLIASQNSNHLSLH